ncbi:hypothetical protein [Levilactobacillus andaensis]|uniref:hypothetical protein n=1 Tax=Levilactobacillus andaensis TaxID=2799570 RepID=UPI0019420CFB|nr:hypothetical protein [Levilactobacillus andaensis]
MLVKTKQCEEKELVCMFKHQQRVARKAGSLEQAADRLIAEVNTGRYPRLWVTMRAKQVRYQIKRVRWHQVKNSDRIKRFAKRHPDYMDDYGWEQLAAMVSDNALK